MRICTMLVFLCSSTLIFVLPVEPVCLFVVPFVLVDSDLTGKELVIFVLVDAIQIVTSMGKSLSSSFSCFVMSCYVFSFQCHFNSLPH